MQVQLSVGSRNRNTPDPCADIREDVGDESAGERVDQSLSRDRLPISGADIFRTVEGYKSVCAIASVRTTRRGVGRPRKSWIVGGKIRTQTSAKRVDQTLRLASPARFSKVESAK